MFAKLSFAAAAILCASLTQANTCASHMDQCDSHLDCCDDLRCNDHGKCVHGQSDGQACDDSKPCNEFNDAGTRFAECAADSSTCQDSCGLILSPCLHDFDCCSDRCTKEFGCFMNE